MGFELGRVDETRGLPVDGLKRAFVNVRVQGDDEGLALAGLPFRGAASGGCPAAEGGVDALDRGVRALGVGLDDEFGFVVSGQGSVLALSQICE